MSLRELQGTTWKGAGELWLNPHGNEADIYECTMSIRETAIDYTWSYEGKAHTGTLALRAGGADFTDTFHSPTVMPCETVPSSWALVDVLGTYGDGSGGTWGWRIYLSRRPDTDELVLQMTNIKPHGEDGRAVRMIGKRV